MQPSAPKNTGPKPPPGATKFPLPGGYGYAWVEGPGFINIIVDDDVLAWAANQLIPRHRASIV